MYLMVKVDFCPLFLLSHKTPAPSIIIFFFLKRGSYTASSWVTWVQKFLRSKQYILAHSVLTNSLKYSALKKRATLVFLKPLWFKTGLAGQTMFLTLGTVLYRRLFVTTQGQTDPWQSPRANSAALDIWIKQWSSQPFINNSCKIC